jgi:hypothetical protein
LEPENAGAPLPEVLELPDALSAGLAPVVSLALAVLPVSR